MNCKLRNSLSALMASGGTLAIVLAVAAPAGTSPVLDGVSAGIPGAEAATAGIVTASSLALDASRNLDVPDIRLEARASRGARHRRHIVVMPYFSFSPRD